MPADEDIPTDANGPGGGGNGATLGSVDHMGGAGSGAGAPGRPDEEGMIPPADIPVWDSESIRAIGNQSSMPPRQTRVRLLSLPARSSDRTCSVDIMRRSRAVTWTIHS